MSKNPFGSDFDPYDALIQLNDRLGRLEQVHNQLASDYLKSQSELTSALVSLNHLQKSHLKLSELVSVSAMAKFDIKSSDLKR